jgi:hypothetical protein
VAYLAVYDDGVQPILGPEMLVDDGFGDSRGSGDLLDGGPCHAIVCEEATGHADELFTALAAGHPRPALRG